MASLTKRGDSYKIMVSLGYDIHGKQIRKTTTFTPPPNVTEGKGRKLAEAFAHDFEKRCRGVSDLGENIRFKDLMGWYYTEVAPNVIREGTIYDQKVLLNLYVVEEFGHLMVMEITTAGLVELWNRLKKDGGRREYYAFRDKNVILLGSRRETARAAGLTENIVYRACSGEKITKASADKISAALGKPFKEIFELVYEKGGLSSATVSHIRATMSAIMRTAVKKGLLEKNPVVNTTPPKPDNKKKLFLDSGQCKQLLDIFEDIENRQLCVMINTLLFTGLRSGELLALQWQDINFDEGTIVVNKTLLRLVGEYRLSEPKTKSSERIVNAQPELFALLKTHRTWQAERRLAFGAAWEQPEQVFTNATGGFYNGVTLNQQFKKILRKNDMPDLHIHDLRHATASLLINAGLPVRVIADHLGHRSTQTTENVYAHVFSESRAKAADAIRIALGN